MPLQGDVRTFGLPAIVRLISEEKKTGVLTVKSANHRSGIYFKAGKIIYASGHLSRDFRLGQVLKANKLIGDETLEEVLKVAKVTGKRLGVVLLEKGYVSKENLTRILLYQFKEVITRTLAWDDAEFVYRDGLNGYVEDIHLELDPMRVVAESERWREFRRHIPHDNVVFQIKPGALQSKSIYAGGALRVLLLIDGRRSVSQIIAETGYSRLQVYKALVSLIAQGAIARKDESEQTAGLSEKAILEFYVNAVQTIMAELGGELGGRKAAASLALALRQSSYYDKLLCAFQLEADTSAVVGRLQDQLEEQERPLSRLEIIKAFNQVLLGLLREEYRLLGGKATKHTVERLRQMLAATPPEQRRLAEAMGRFLARFEDVSQFNGSHRLSGTLEVDLGGSSGELAPKLRLDSVGGAAIITFYSQLLQLVVADLERELGAKARKVYQGLVEQSQYYQTFLSQFSLEAGARANVSRIRDHTKTMELQLSKGDLIKAFQHLLVGLLREENRLLGRRATQQTVAKLVERMAASETQFKPLVNHLSALLVRQSASM